MSRLPDTTYRFATESQWQAGIRDQLELVDGVLRVPDALSVRPIASTGPDDAGAVLAADRAGRVDWLRPDDPLLRRWGPIGVVEVGVLVGGSTVLDLASDCGQAWVLTDSGIERHRRRGLQRLGLVEPPATGVVAIAADGSDGIWALEMGDECSSRLRHFDCWGRASCDTVELPEPADEHSRIATTRDGGHVVVLPPGGARHLYVVEVCPDPTVRVFGRRTDAPVAVTVDADERIHLLITDPCDGGTWLETLTLRGDVEERTLLELPAGFGPVTDLVAADRLVLAGAGGLATLERTSGVGVRRVSTFLTPTLVSPHPGEQRTTRSDVPTGGWHRAEVEVTLPRGATIEIAWATSDDPADAAAADEILGDRSVAPGARLAELERRLTWRPEDCAVYESDLSDPARSETLPALIDRVDDRFLWVRIRLVTPAASASPSVAALHVRYPAMSYIDDLPAVYREEPSSAAQLRRILAPFEVLYDGLDTTIDGLSDRIDPATAGDEWTSTLLRWLGMPPLDDLAASVRRTLLREAPELLAGRGTTRALQRVLEIVTGTAVRVRDHGAGPGGWFLPRADRQGGARLGVDTVVAAQQPPSFRSGAAVLGETPLGVGCTDPELVLAQRSGLVEVRVGVNPDDAEALRPILRRILSVFAPAHCRVVIDDSPGALDGLSAGGLDGDIRLAGVDAGGGPGGDDRLPSDSRWRLGATTALGWWRLPEPEFPTAMVGQTPICDDRTYLI